MKRTDGCTSQCLKGKHLRLYDFQQSVTTFCWQSSDKDGSSSSACYEWRGTPLPGGAGMAAYKLHVIFCREMVNCIFGTFVRVSDSH